MQNTNTQAWYAAFKAKDARFDGRFFIGVSSTGIYCRPICKARLPRAENCTYYESAAAAEHAGFRPCLLCRPELAPGNAPVDASLSLAHRIARLLEENCSSGQHLDQCLQKLGYSDRHIRRAFTAEYKLAPVQYLQTCRLLLAKNLLTDTQLTVTELAMAAGFESLRRFNELFKKQYGLAPTDLRRQATTARGSQTQLTLGLGYRPPYPWQQMLTFLADRAIPGLELVSQTEYARTVRLVSAGQKDVNGWIRVKQRPQKNALAVTLDSALLPVLPQVLAKTRQMFDLSCDPAIIDETLSAMNTVRPGLCVPGTRLPGCLDPFEMSVRAVLGQQQKMERAQSQAARLLAALGKPLATGLAGLTHVFPSPAEILSLQDQIFDYLGPLGIAESHAKTILALARAFVIGQLDFGPGAQAEVEMQKLLSIDGIGTETAQYIAIRALGWPDAFPHADCGIKKALAPLAESEIRHRAEAWRPWRSYATINLWNALQVQSAKQNQAPIKLPSSL